jgi:hypothetical protein
VGKKQKKNVSSKDIEKGMREAESCAFVGVVMMVMAMVVSFSGSSSNEPSVLAVFRPKHRPKLPVLKQA